MFDLRVDLAGLQLVRKIRMRLGDETALHIAQHVHLGEDAGDQAMDLQGCRLMAGDVPRQIRPVATTSG